MKKVILLLSLLLLVSSASGQKQLDPNGNSTPFAVLNKKIQITNIYSVTKPKPVSVVNTTPYAAPPICASRNDAPYSDDCGNTVPRQGGLEVIKESGKSSDRRIYGYIFAATLQIENHSGKVIKSVKWEFTIGSSPTETSPKKFSFKTVKNVAPNEKAELSDSEVVMRVSKVPNSNYSEAFITEIEFADGTKWKHPKDKK